MTTELRAVFGKEIKCGLKSRLPIFREFILTAKMDVILGWNRDFIAKAFLVIIYIYIYFVLRIASEEATMLAEVNSGMGS